MPFGEFFFVPNEVSTGIITPAAGDTQTDINQAPLVANNNPIYLVALDIVRAGAGTFSKIQVLDALGTVVYLENVAATSNSYHRDFNYPIFVAQSASGTFSIRITHSATAASAITSNSSIKRLA